MPRRGQVRKRENGKYIARVYVGKDANGQRHWTSKTFAKKKEADAWLAEQLNDKAQGTFAAPTRENLSSYLERWLDEVASRRVRERTRGDYANAIDRYLVPRLGHLKLTDLRPHHIQVAYNEIAENNGPHTARKCHAVLHSALSQAVKWGMTSRNAADLVEPPKAPRREMRPLTPKEVAAFLEALEGDRYRAYFILLLDTGMRPGEALALTWADVDLDTGIVQIRRAMSTGRSKPILGDPKTTKSRRSVIITQETVQALRRHRKATAAEREANPYYQDMNLLFPSTTGGYSDQHNISYRHFKPLLRKLGLPESIRIYDLRHTVATLLLAANTHPKLVADRLGHANTTMTLDRYTHVLPTMQGQVAKTMEMFLTKKPKGDREE